MEISHSLSEGLEIGKKFVILHLWIIWLSKLFIIADLALPDQLKVTFLGTGTSQGVPVIGCDCRICQSVDTRDKRLRTSVLLHYKGKNVAIDAGPDFRQQMLRHQVNSLQAILLTHDHNDHLIGLDEIRPFNFKHRKAMSIYATQAVQQSVKERFSYVFDDNPYPGAPAIELRSISRKAPFQVEDIQVVPIEAMHGNMPVLGFRVGGFTYLTDIKTISDSESEKALNSKVLVLNALHRKVHHSHLNLDEALKMVERLQPELTYLTHISHRMGKHTDVSEELPQNVFLAYDGLEIFI